MDQNKNWQPKHRWFDWECYKLRKRVSKLKTLLLSIYKSYRCMQQYRPYYLITIGRLHWQKMVEDSRPFVEVDGTREAMLVHLCDWSEAHFKSQQVGEPELTREQKWQIAEELLDKSWPLFLARFAQHLLPVHAKYFRREEVDRQLSGPDDDEYMVQFYLAEIEKHSNPPKKEAQVKNRRLEALKRLAMEGDYFSESEMKKRNPLLYQELVGKYLTEEEKKKRDDFDYSGATLSRVLLERYDRDMTQKLMEQQMEEYDDTSTNENMEDEDSDEFSEEGQLWGETKLAGEAYLRDRRYHKAQQDEKRRKQHRLRMRQRHSDGEELEDEENGSNGDSLTEIEKKMMFEEFRSHMFTSFLQGKDDFDYTSVDANTDYDDLDELCRDSEEKYFDSESPTPVMSTQMELDTPEGCDETEMTGLEEESSHDPLDDFMKEINKL